MRSRETCSFCCTEVRSNKLTEPFYLTWVAVEWFTPVCTAQIGRKQGECWNTARRAKYGKHIPTIFRAYHTRVMHEKTVVFVLTKRIPKGKIRAY